MYPKYYKEYAYALAHKEFHVHKPILNQKARFEAKIGSLLTFIFINF